ncbi:hypothetical protein [Epibacterium sp. Ofav1-8]|uniref:hypothetical protein n=1 Tax=Epibacterium sp. Ofav1-8 TaxID=2917735 RepID=UPI001EF6AE8A|nr:hypothetical protein [Epibacterium sp. Ofav1-8]MCG7623442.1 hypothetical protein [Epibacterium sp. Ofav1-8]
MPCWIVTFEDSDGVSALRTDPARRAAHIAFVRACPGLQIGGPLALTPMQDFPGAIWTVEAETRQDVMRLIQRDPYFVAGLRRPVIRRETEQDPLVRLLR